MPRTITASMLYNLTSCPHRVFMDLYADPADRDQVSPFVQLLWERGAAHERSIMEGGRLAYLDLTGYGPADREALTTEAMANGESLIYGGRISAADLVGVPDLLRRTERGGYMPGDIKSGRGMEGPAEKGRPKKQYAVQLALYVDVLERMGVSAGRRAFIWDVHGDEVIYDLTAPLGPRKPKTLWDDYQVVLAETRSIVARSQHTLAAYGGNCKLCHWYTTCLGQLRSCSDLTLIPELGRSKRDVMAKRLPNVPALAHADLQQFIDGDKTAFPGIGPVTLGKFQQRSRLLVTPQARPYLKAPVSLPESEREIFFDIEVDPMRDLCYLHGFIERLSGDNSTEAYRAYFADEPTTEAERRAFREAWVYLQDRMPCVIYFYSKYERTMWRALQARYPDICNTQDVESLFDPSQAVDLYFDVIAPNTEWPTYDYSIKTLAKYLGFRWRDSNPSGAASIEWFDQWVESGDVRIKQRILDYNEDDCRATRVLLDGIRQLRMRQ